MVGKRFLFSITFASKGFRIGCTVGDEDCSEDCDELDHLDEALTKSSSSFKTMFNKGVKYQSYLNRVVETKRINDEENMETLQINDDDDQTDDDNLYPFDSFNTLRAIGFNVYGKNRENYVSNF